ncbi:MAG: hypothetical protein ACRELF_13330, partial [Gemmataceae bacterium]
AFGYPGRIDAYERVWLTFAGIGGADEVRLNKHLLGHIVTASEFEVTPLLAKQCGIVGSQPRRRGRESPHCGHASTLLRRQGRQALTTRGMREPEMRQIAAWIDEVLANPEDTAGQSRVRQQVRQLCQQFPAPANAR